MNWRWLLPFPLAAAILGTPVNAPQLREPLPQFTDPICDYQAATESFLLAYAYAREAPQRARALLRAAEEERELCAADTSELGARIEALKGLLKD